MQRIYIFIAMLACAMTTMAQEVTEGVSYYLPKTALRFVLLVEKTSYTPGDFAIYSERYLKTSVSTESATAFNLLSYKLETIGVPDKEKTFFAKMNQKHSMTSIDKDDNGVLLAVNTTAGAPKEYPRFVAAKKEKALVPRDYMTQEILSAGSTAKMAELTALEIYDIRENRNLLNKGQADFMPQDGEQLRIMLRNLDKQERALSQLFLGRTERDTFEVEVTYIPMEEVKNDVLFRFSTKLGVVDNDDLAGVPYCISVEDYHIMPTLNVGDEMQRDKVGSGVCVNLPGKIKVTLSQDGKPLYNYDLYAAQFGRTEELGTSLFSKKYTTTLRLSPVTGNAEHIETVPLK